MTDIKKGDRVKVTIEGVVRDTMGDYGALVHNDDNHWLAEFYHERPGVTIEKVEPPVEVFKPGDRLQSRRFGHQITLGDEGYLQHHGSGSVTFYERKRGYLKGSEFHSGNYEKLS